MRNAKRRQFRVESSAPRVQRLHGLEAIRHIHPKLAKPLEKALRASEAGDLPTALWEFGECVKIDPLNKAVLYFAAESVQRAYFLFKMTQPPPDPDKVAYYRQGVNALLEGMAEAYPDDPVALHNAGRFIQDDGNEVGSIPWYQKALRLRREQVESWGNMGAALYATGDIVQAEACWSKCVAFEAENASGSLAQAYVWLRRGDYLRGWPALNDRWRDPTFTATYGRKDLGGMPWFGEPLRKGDTLLLHGEQGHGDHVMFGRYVRDAIAAGLPVIGLETRAPLKRWFEACLPDLPIYIRDTDKLPSFSHHAPLMSLPGLLKLGDPTPALHPSNVFYLPSSLGHSQPSGARPMRVGIVWKGTSGNIMDTVRSIPDDLLGELADIPGVTWVSLQYDPSGGASLTARAWLGKRVECAEYTDVLGMAEIMAGLDAVVSSDTLAAHVAGSIGVPTYLLQRFNREWRWGSHTESTAWYQSVTQLTQEKPGDWATLLRSLRERLQR